MDKKFNLMIPDKLLGEEGAYLSRMMDKAFKIVLKVSMSMGVEGTKLIKSITLPMIIVNEERYLEAERRYWFSLEDPQGSDEAMSKEEFTSLSAHAALHFASYMVESLSELNEEVTDVPKEFAGMLSILSSNMERCFANYMCFLDEDKRRELVGYGHNEKKSRAKGGKVNSSKYKAARDWAKSYADNEWKENPKYPLSKMAGDLLSSLEAHDGYRGVGLDKLPSLNTIKGWIKSSEYRQKLPSGAPPKNK